MNITTLLLILAATILLITVTRGNIIFYDKAENITDAVPLFLWRTKNGIFVTLLGFIEKDGMMAPVYRPMIMWGYNKTKFILELNLDVFSLGITFVKRFPYIKLNIENRKETLFG